MIQTATVQCKKCGCEVQISAPERQWEKYFDGAPVQEAFPTMCPEAREILVSGLCTDCFDDITNPQEEIA